MSRGALLLSALALLAPELAAQPRQGPTLQPLERVEVPEPAWGLTCHVRAFAWLDERRLAVLGCRGGYPLHPNLVVLDARSGGRLMEAKLGPFRSYALAARGQRIWTISDGERSQLVCVDARSGRVLARGRHFEYQTAAQARLALVGERHLLVTGDDGLELFDRETLARKRVLEEVTISVESMLRLADGRVLCAGYSSLFLIDERGRVRTLGDGLERRTYDSTQSLAQAPDGSLAILAGKTVWRCATPDRAPEPLFSLARPGWAIAFGADARELLVTDQDGRLLRYRLGGQLSVRQLPPMQHPLYALTRDRAGRVLVGSSVIERLQGDALLGGDRMRGSARQLDWDGRRLVGLPGESPWLASWERGVIRRWPRPPGRRAVGFVLLDDGAIAALDRRGDLWRCAGPQAPPKRVQVLGIKPSGVTRSDTHLLITTAESALRVALADWKREAPVALRRPRAEPGGRSVIAFDADGKTRLRVELPSQRVSLRWRDHQALRVQGGQLRHRWDDGELLLSTPTRTRLLLPPGGDRATLARAMLHTSPDGRFALATPPDGRAWLLDLRERRWHRVAGLRSGARVVGWSNGSLSLGCWDKRIARYRLPR